MKTFYEEICVLKDIVRRGWILRLDNNDNGKNNKRLESDAEHTYSMILLALELMHKNNLKLDELKVLKMVAYHELCEIDVGDTIPFDKVSKQEKFNKEYACVKRLASTYNMPDIETLWLEYEKSESKEAEFVRMLDKVDAILQADIYEKQYNKKGLKKEFEDNSKKLYDKFKKLKR